MIDAEIGDVAMKTVSDLLGATPNNRDRSELMSALLMICYNVLRNMEDDQFVIGWLESALSDVKENAPIIVARQAH